MKLYAYLALALILSALLYGAVHVWRKAERVDVAEAKQHDAEAALVDEKKGRADERKEYERQRKLNTEISNGYQSDLRRLELERANVPVVRLCKRSAVPAESSATPGTASASAGRLGGEASQDPSQGPDIGAELIEYGLACEANSLQLDRLIEWTKSR